MYREQVDRCYLTAFRLIFMAYAKGIKCLVPYFTEDSQQIEFHSHALEVFCRINEYAGDLGELAFLSKVSNDVRKEVYDVSEEVFVHARDGILD